MFLVGALRWWYGAGWRRRVGLLHERLAGLADLFSFAVIGRTLFAPFRQISAAPVGGAMAVQLRAWFDKLFSRLVGAVVRLFVLVAGVVVCLVALLIGIVELILWPLMPLLPAVGVVLFSLGVRV